MIYFCYLKIKWHRQELKKIFFFQIYIYIHKKYSYTNHQIGETAASELLKDQNIFQTMLSMQEDLEVQIGKERTIHASTLHEEKTKLEISIICWKVKII